MSIQVSRALAAFFEEEVGHALRLVAHYDADTIDFVYIRDDLDEQYTESDFDRTFEIHRKEKREAEQQESVIVAGKHHCTLRVFDGALVFNFAQTDGIGTVVSLGPSVGRNFLSFVTKCLRELDEHTPHDVSAPQWAV